MEILVIGGVDNAGKSTAIRHLMKYLSLSEELAYKFLTQKKSS